MQSLFEGIRVIEFGRFIAAPYCCQLLADGGAEVIKVEPLTGDDARRNGTRYSATEAQQFLNKNRGKKSIACQLSDPAILEALKNLIAESDVVVANFRPGQAEKLGLDYQSLKQLNPRLIYAENTGYGKKGPMAEMAGMDIALQGFSGIAPLTRDGPQPLRDPVIDYTAALLLAWGISSALFHRERTGQGQQIDVSLLQAALVLQNNHLTRVMNQDEGRRAKADQVQNALSTGASWEEIAQQTGSFGGNSPIAIYYGFFRTQDELICLGGGGLQVQKRLLALLELEDPWVTDPKFKPEDIKAYTQEQRQRVEAKLQSQPAEAWIRLLAENNIPASRVHFKAQMFDEPQVRANNYLSSFTHPDLGDVEVVSPPVGLSETPLSIQGASPLLGDRSREILLSAGLSEAETVRLIEAGIVVESGKGQSNS